MTRLYIVRHCEAAGNKSRVFHGSFNTEITENGQKQLEQLKERFKDIKYDVIYSSDLNRAVKTAEAVNSHLKLNISLTKDIREIFGGKWENIPFVKIKELYPEEYNLWEKNDESFKMPEGESYCDFFERIVLGFEKILKDNKGKTIVAATHGTVIKMYLSYILGYGLKNSSNVPWCDNTGVSCIDFDDDLNGKVVFMNDNSHLSDETKTIIHQEWWKKSQKEGKV